MGGKSGYKWGDAGACYTHDGSDESKNRAKRKALNQGIAMGDIKVGERRTVDVLAQSLRGKFAPAEAARGLSLGLTLTVSEALALRNGESLDDLSCLIRDAMMNEYPGQGWVEAIYSDYLVFYFYSDSPRAGELVQINWRRDGQTGMVSVDPATEVQVRRVTSYQPVGEAFDPAKESRSIREDLLRETDPARVKYLEETAHALLTARDGLTDEYRARVDPLTGEALRNELYRTFEIG